ncbi:MAG: 2-C-methyl-D-erythritol 4-phosphate cytidylyltransferase [Candidatus Hydrogenedentota bacterium]
MSTNTTVKTQSIVPAAGMGSRLGAELPKALIPIANRPLLAHTLERLREAGVMDGAIIVAPVSFRDAVARVLAEAFPGHSFTIADGADERQASVARGLEALAEDTQIVLIHDAARPFVEPAVVQDGIEAAWRWGAATAATPCVDTILVSDEEGFLEATPDRRRLWACQTPQIFRTEVIVRAHGLAAREGYFATDDATLARRTGTPVKLIESSPSNFKITTPNDLAMAQRLLSQ